MAPVADPGKIVLSGADGPKDCRKSPQTPRAEEGFDIGAFERPKSGQRKALGVSAAPPALEPTALVTAAPKCYASKPAERTNLTFPK